MITGAPVNILDFGTNTVPGTTNMAPALQAAVNASKKVYIPPGLYNIGSPVVLTQDCNIIGAGKSVTTLYKNYASGSTTEGMIQFGIYAGGCSNMALASLLGSTQGAMISAIATSVAPAGFLDFDNLYITSVNDYHNWDIYLDGSAKTTAPIGVRDVCISNSELFGCLNGAVYINQGVNISLNGVSSFPAGGTTGKVVITGVSSPTNQTFYVSINSPILNGLELNQCQWLQANVALISGNVVTTASVFRSRITTGQTAGSITLGWDATQNYYDDYYFGPNYQANGFLLTSGGISLTNAGTINAATTGTVTKVSGIGTHSQTVLPNTKSFTFTTTASSKMFSIANSGNGEGCLAHCDNLSSTITLISNPSSFFENAVGTPGDGKISLTKSAASHVITVLNNTGGSINIVLLVFGAVTSVTEPA